MNRFMKLLVEPKNPCKGKCDHRSPTCHGQCMDYKIFRDLLDQYNSDIRKEKAPFDNDPDHEKKHGLDWIGKYEQ